MKAILDSKKPLSRPKFAPHLHLTILKHDLTLLVLPGDRLLGMWMRLAEFQTAAFDYFTTDLWELWG